MITGTASTKVTAWLLIVAGMSQIHVGRAACADDPVPADRVRKTVRRSLSYLEQQGQRWIEKNDCMSCHRTSFAAWSHIEAAASGIKVEPQVVTDLLGWNHTDLLTTIPKEDQAFAGERKVHRNPSGAGQMLLATSARQLRDSEREKQRLLADYLAARQLADGHWKPMGQLPAQKRDIRETTLATTGWILLGLQSAVAQNVVDPDTLRTPIGRGIEYVLSQPPGRSTEVAVVTLLVADSADRGTVRDQQLQQLLEKQNVDGGWGWLKGEASDVLATAQVLYALESIEHRSRANARAVGYLAQQQNPDGSWDVHGTKKRSANRVTETASYWGSAWASIALSRSLRPAHSRADSRDPESSQPRTR